MPKSHGNVLLLERSRTEFMYDLDPLQSGETRVKVLGIPSKEEWLFSAVTVHGLASEMPVKRKTDFDIFQMLASGFPNNLVARATLPPIHSARSGL